MHPQPLFSHFIFPAIVVHNGFCGGVLVDDFKGHSRDVVKDFVGQFKSSRSGAEPSDEDISYPLCAFKKMAGGVTPKAQPIDVIVGKEVFKGYYRELYDLYMLDAPVSSKGYPIAPSWHLCSGVHRHGRRWYLKNWSERHGN